MAHIVKILIQQASVDYMEITEMGDHLERFTPSGISLRGLGWTNTGAEISVEIPASDIECGELLRLFDKISERIMRS